MAGSKCPACENPQNNRLRVTSTDCSVCHNRFKGGMYQDVNAKACPDTLGKNPKCKDGENAARKGKDCQTCQGTGKKLIDCPNKAKSKCSNGKLTIWCTVEFHDPKKHFK